MASLDLNYLGRRCYQAYRDAAEGRSLVTGAPLPEWSDMPDAIRAAWVAAATEAVDQWVRHDGQMPGGG